MLVLRNATVVHLHPPEARDFPVDVVVEDGKISKVGRDAGAGMHANTVLDLTGKIVMPGLVCSHNHFYSGLARGVLAEIPPVTDFVTNLANLWWRLDRAIDKESLWYSGLVCCIDAIKSGCTAVVDHHASPSIIDGSLDILKGAFEKCGLRGVLCYETTERNGKEGMQLGIEENSRFAHAIEEQISKGESLIVESMIGGHAPFTLPDHGLKALGDVVEKTGRGFHIHVAEDAYDQSYTHRYYRKDILDRLVAFGLVNDRGLLAHGIYLTPNDVEILNRRDAFLVHNCRSNMNNSVGYGRVISSVGNVGIGTDGIGSDMFQEVKIAYFKNRDAGGSLAPDRYLEFLQNGNIILARAFSGATRDKKEPRAGAQLFGRIEPGYAADITVLDYHSPTPLRAENLGGHVIFGMGSKDVDTVIVNGEVIMANRQFRWDIASVYREARLVAEKLWRAMDRIEA